VNRKIGILAGLVALGVAAYLGSYLRAQQNAANQAQTPLQTRVALINLGQVIKNYQKFKNFEVGLKAESEKYQKEFETKRTIAVKKQERMKEPTISAAEREQLEKEVKTLQREMQDMAEEVKQKIGKEEFDLMVQLYKEVRDEVTITAKKYGIELVLQYNDAPEPDAFSPALFQRKLANGACMPMYMDQRMDITAYVTEMLNRHLASGTPASAPRSN
jgi:Skp family chaperone for outer membrane proteins